MPTFVNQPWDSVTAPALPSGWTFNGTWATATGTVRSAPNELRNDEVGAVSFASYNTVADNADVTVSSAMLVGDISTSVSLEGLVGARFTSQTYAGSSGYFAGFNLGTAEDKGIHLVKRVSGSNTDLATVIPTVGNELAINIWYVITLDLAGTTISVKVQRDSDSKYLTSSGTWQSSSTNCISVTDSAISAAGYVGLLDYCFGTLRYVHFDDFLAVTPGSGATTFTLTGPTRGPAGAASANFNVTPNGPTTATWTPNAQAGCTFTPSTLTLAGTTPKTFTVTRATAGSSTINGTASGLTPPASITYTAVTTTTGNFAYQDAPPSTATTYQVMNDDNTGFQNEASAGTSSSFGTGSVSGVLIPADYLGRIEFRQGNVVATDVLTPPTGGNVAFPASGRIVA